MQTDATVDSKASERNGPRKFRSLFKCWRKQNLKIDQKKKTDSSLNHDSSHEKIQNKSTLTEHEQNNEQERAVAKTESDKQVGSERNSHKGRRCQKCFKRTSEKDSDCHRIDKRYCRSGYCNTNTIVFPNDYESDSFDLKDTQYLQLIKDIMKDETRKDLTDMCDIRREIDKQRGEIQELKAILVQKLLEKRTSNKDNNVNSSFPGSSVRRKSHNSTRRQSMDSSKRRTSISSKRGHTKKHKYASDSSLVPITSESISRRTNDDKEMFTVNRPAAFENKITGTERTTFWVRLFGKK